MLAQYTMLAPVSPKAALATSTYDTTPVAFVPCNSRRHRNRVFSNETDEQAMISISRGPATYPVCAKAQGRLNDPAPMMALAMLAEAWREDMLPVSDGCSAASLCSSLSSVGLFGLVWGYLVRTSIQSFGYLQTRAASRCRSWLVVWFRWWVWSVVRFAGLWCSRRFSADFLIWRLA